MFKVTITETQGTGAGYGAPANLYVSAQGVGMHRSPRKAREIAVSALGADIRRKWSAKGVEADQIPVLGGERMEKNGRVIREID